MKEKPSQEVPAGDVKDYMSVEIEIVKFFDEDLGKMVSREVHLSPNATCELCGKITDKSEFCIYGYDFNKNIYIGWCFECTRKRRFAKKEEPPSISLEERIRIRNNILKYFPNVKFREIKCGDEND